MSFFGCAKSHGCFGPAEQKEPQLVLHPMLPFRATSLEAGNRVAAIAASFHRLPTKKETERLLSEAMLNLSVEEREQVLETVHAVPRRLPGDEESNEKDCANEDFIGKESQ